jgi:hypothetical protein
MQSVYQERQWFGQKGCGAMGETMFEMTKGMGTWTEGAQELLARANQRPHAVPRDINEPSDPGSRDVMIEYSLHADSVNTPSGYKGNDRATGVALDCTPFQSLSQLHQPRLVSQALLVTVGSHLKSQSPSPAQHLPSHHPVVDICWVSGVLLVQGKSRCEVVPPQARNYRHWSGWCRPEQLHPSALRLTY